MSRFWAIFMTITVPLAWLVVAAVGVYAAVTLFDLSDLTPDGTPRTLLDKLFPLVFVPLIPLGLYRAWTEYKEARDTIPLANAADEAARKQRQRRKAIARQDTFPLNEDQRASLLDAVASLRGGGVIRPGEVDEARLLAVADGLGLEDADLAELCHVLADYEAAYGRLQNALFVPVQVEIFEPDIIGYIESFARMAGRADGLTFATMQLLNADARPAIAAAHLALDGTPHQLKFEYHAKYPPDKLFEGLAVLFNDETARFALGHFDSILLISRLTPAQRDTMNAALNPEFETFQWL